MLRKHLSVFFFITILFNSSGAFSSPRNAQEEFAYSLLHRYFNLCSSYRDKTWGIFTAMPQEEKNKYLPYICGALKDKDAAVRGNAIRACGEIGPASALCLSDALNNQQIKLTDVVGILPKLGTLTPAMEKAIVEFIKSPEFDSHLGLAEKLVELDYSSNNVAEALRPKLKQHKNRTNNTYLLCAQAKMGEFDAVRPVLKQLIKAGEPNVPQCIAELGTKAVSFAPDIINSSSIRLKDKIEILIKIGARRELLLPLLVSGVKGSGMECAAAADAVLKLGLLNDELLSSVCTWGSCVNARYYEAPRSFSSFSAEDTKLLLPRIQKCAVPCAKSSERNWIDIALKQMAPKLKDQMLVFLDSDSVRCSEFIKAVALSGPSAAKPLVEIMRQASGVGGQRQEIARIIASMGPDAAPAIPELSELFNCPDSNIYTPAAWILGAIGSEALPVLHRMEDNSLYADRLMAAISFMPPSPEAFAMLSRLVASSKDVGILKQAVNVLKTWNSYPNLSAVLLLQISDNPDTELSTRALDTLSGFGGDARSVVPSMRKRLIHALIGQDYIKAYSIALALSRVDEPSVLINDLLVTIYANTDRIMAPLPVDSLSNVSRLSRKAILSRISNMKDVYNLEFDMFSASPKITHCSQSVLPVFRLLIRSDLLSRAELEAYANSENSCYSFAAVSALCEMPTSEALTSCLKHVERMLKINPKNTDKLEKLVCGIGTPEALQICQSISKSRFCR